MSNLIGRSGYHIFIVLKKEKKILKHNYLFLIQEPENSSSQQKSKKEVSL